MGVSTRFRAVCSAASYWRNIVFRWPTGTEISASPNKTRIVVIATPPYRLTVSSCRALFRALPVIRTTAITTAFDRQDFMLYSICKADSHCHTKHDKTVAPACRPPPPRRRPGRQLRLAARPPTRSDVVRRTKCKHAVKCCVWLNLNLFTERHATRVIYRLTVQTLPDCLETQFTPPDTTQS